MKRLIFLLVLTASVAAQPTITDVTPKSGPTPGGITITIKGTGFEFCQPCSPPVPPRVYFGGVQAGSVNVIDNGTIQVTLPANFPGLRDILLQQSNGVARARGFTYTGTVEEGFNRVLLPIFLPPIDGAFGSQFRTELRLANSRETTVPLFGLKLPCGIEQCLPYDLRDVPYELEPGQSTDPGDFDYIGKPGRFFYIAKSAPEVFANLRVYDVSRSAFNFGTELPVVQEHELSTDPIRLLGVPLDPRFRNTLRIYATAETSAAVRIGNTTHNVHVAPGADLFDPAYAQFSDFPMGQGTVDVTITPSTVVPPMPGLVPPRVWAFISVTNNDTQLITTISPQR